MKRTTVRHLLLFALFVLTPVVVVVVRSADLATTSDGFYRERLLECSPAGKMQGKPSNPVACFTQTFEIDIAAGDTPQLLGEVGEVLEERPELYTLCHAAAHAASKTALEASDDLFELLDEVASDTRCDWGFGHGIMDALALDGENPETLRGLIAWCAKHVDDERLYGLCNDGIGHYSLGSSGNLERSAANCSLIPTEAGKMSCGGGVLMQLFEPADKAQSLYSRDEAPHVVPELCKRWKIARPEPADQAGCSNGAGYVYGLEVRDAAWALIRANLPADDAPRKAPFVAAISKTLATGIARCDDLVTPVGPCMDMLTQSLPLRLWQQHPETFNALCGLFDGSGRVESCLAQRDQQYL